MAKSEEKNSKEPLIPESTTESSEKPVNKETTTYDVIKLLFDAYG